MRPARLALNQRLKPLNETARRRHALQVSIYALKTSLSGAIHRARAWEVALDETPDDPGARRAHAQALARVFTLEKRLRALRGLQRRLRAIPDPPTPPAGETVGPATQPANGDSQLETFS